jgi:hypothetical protein
MTDDIDLPENPSILLKWLSEAVAKDVPSELADAICKFHDDLILRLRFWKAVLEAAPTAPTPPRSTRYRPIGIAAEVASDRIQKLSALQEALQEVLPDDGDIERQEALPLPPAIRRLQGEAAQ